MRVRLIRHMEHELSVGEMLGRPPAPPCAHDNPHYNGHRQRYECRCGLVRSMRSTEWVKK